MLSRQAVVAGCVFLTVLLATLLRWQVVKADVHTGVIVLDRWTGVVWHRWSPAEEPIAPYADADRLRKQRDLLTALAYMALAASGLAFVYLALRPLGSRGRPVEAFLIEDHNQA